MINEIKKDLYNKIKKGFNGQCVIIYNNNGVNTLIYTHRKKYNLEAINNISFNDILYLQCQEGNITYNTDKTADLNYATDTEIGIIPFSYYSCPEHIKMYEYMDNIYKQFGVENYED